MRIRTYVTATVMRLIAVLFVGTFVASVATQPVMAHDPPRAIRLAITTAPQTVEVNSLSKKITVELQNAEGKPVAIQRPLQVALTASLTASFYKDSQKQQEIVDNILEIPAGQSQQSFYYVDTAAGRHEITALSSGDRPLRATQTIIVTEAPAPRAHFIETQLYATDTAWQKIALRAPSQAQVFITIGGERYNLTKSGQSADNDGNSLWILSGSIDALKGGIPHKIKATVIVGEREYLAENTLQLVSLPTFSLEATYAKQDDTLTVSGTVNDALQLARYALHIKNTTGAIVYKADIIPTPSGSYTLPVISLADQKRGDYTITIQAHYDDIILSEESREITLQPKDTPEQPTQSTPSDDTASQVDEDAKPATASTPTDNLATLQVPEVSIEPAPRLSTAFSSPHTSQNTNPSEAFMLPQSPVSQSSNKESSLPLPIQNRPGEDTAEVKGVVAPSSQGWRIFGVAWYWYGGGALAVIAGWRFVLPRLTKKP